MSSILKVDQIQLADGSTPTAGDLGLNTTGSVLQVVSDAYTATAHKVTTSGSYADSGVSLSITPKSTSSKMLVVLNWDGQLDNEGRVYMVRTVNGSSTNSGERRIRSDAGDMRGSMATFSWFDEPNTTDEVTYTFQVKNALGTYWYYQHNSFYQSQYIMEIAG